MAFQSATRRSPRSRKVNIKTDDSLPDYADSAVEMNLEETNDVEGYPLYGRTRRLAKDTKTANITRPITRAQISRERAPEPEYDESLTRRVSMIHDQLPHRRRRPTTVRITAPKFGDFLEFFLGAIGPLMCGALLAYLFRSTMQISKISVKETGCRLTGLEYFCLHDEVKAPIPQALYEDPFDTASLDDLFDSVPQMQEISYSMLDFRAYNLNPVGVELLVLNEKDLIPGGREAMKTLETARTHLVKVSEGILKFSDGSREFMLTTQLAMAEMASNFRWHLGMSKKDPSYFWQLLRSSISWIPLRSRSHLSWHLVQSVSRTAAEIERGFQGLHDEAHPILAELGRMKTSLEQFNDFVETETRDMESRCRWGPLHSKPPICDTVKLPQLSYHMADFLSYTSIADRQLRDIIGHLDTLGESLQETLSYARRVSSSTRMKWTKADVMATMRQIGRFSDEYRLMFGQWNEEFEAEVLRLAETSNRKKVRHLFAQEISELT